MKVKILILLNGVLLGLAAYLFYSTQSYKENMAFEKQRVEAATDSLQYFKYKSIGDSLILADDYEGAMVNFRKADSIFADSRLVEERVALTREAKSRKENMNRLKNRVNHIQDNMLLVSDSLGGEISQKDSIMRLSRTEINILMHEADQLRDSLASAHAEMERLAASLGQLELETSEGIKIYYAGDLTNGKANGHGYGLFETGGIYSGEWKDNKRHGTGKYIWKDGNMYVGEYQDDKRHGTGTYYFTTGEKYVGEWENNKRSGQGVMYGNEGEKILSGRWEDDQIVEAEG